MPTDLPADAQLARTPLPLTIIFGTETGTAEMLARQASEQAATLGFVPQVLDMAEVDMARLSAEKHLLVVVSTCGYGEPPGNAIELHAALASRSPKSLPASLPPELKFSVCALGDERYAEFCQCGREFDAFLEAWGATRIAPRADCTLDYDETFETWLRAALNAFTLAASADERVEAHEAPAIAV